MSLVGSGLLNVKWHCFGGDSLVVVVLFLCCFFVIR